MVDSGLDLTGVDGIRGHEELDDPEVLRRIWNHLVDAERKDFDRYDLIRFGCTTPPNYI